MKTHLLLLMISLTLLLPVSTAFAQSTQPAPKPKREIKPVTSPEELIKRYLTADHKNDLDLLRSCFDLSKGLNRAFVRKSKSRFKWQDEGVIKVRNALVNKYGKQMDKWQVKQKSDLPLNNQIKSAVNTITMIDKDKIAAVESNTLPYEHFAVEVVYADADTKVYMVNTASGWKFDLTRNKDQLKNIRIEIQMVTWREPEHYLSMINESDDFKTFKEELKQYKYEVASGAVTNSHSKLKEEVEDEKKVN